MAVASASPYIDDMRWALLAAFLSSPASAGGLVEGVVSAGAAVPALLGAGPVARSAPPVQPGFCQASWEEKPGTTDYTVFDQSTNKPAARSDRSARWSLLENEDFQGKTLCERAAFLKPCFEKALAKEPRGASFSDWAKRHKLDPVRVLLAVAASETAIGVNPDHCRKGRCNGVGLMQVISAIDDEGKLMRWNDPRWDGITFNILTNIKYAIRVADDKLPAKGLWTFAYRYNASATASAYAGKVQGNYNELRACR